MSFVHLHSMTTTYDSKEFIYEHNRVLSQQKSLCSFTLCTTTVYLFVATRLTSSHGPLIQIIGLARQAQ